MAMKINLFILMLAIAAILGTGCDSAHPPVIANRYRKTIQLDLSFVGTSPQTAIELSPNTAYFQQYKGFELTEIRVREESGRIRVYGAEALAKLRSNWQGSFEFWILTEDGLSLGSKEDLRKLNEERRQQR